MSLLGGDYWRRIISFDALLEEGAIDEEVLELTKYVETAEGAWQIIKNYYKL